ncbi:MAG: double zinc ribbon domain-containing protein [Candidatus Helarchaeota archaeon]
MEYSKGIKTDEFKEKTLQWNTIYYCEQTTLLSPAGEQLLNRAGISQQVVKKRWYWKDKKIASQLPYTAYLPQIRSGKALYQFQQLINQQFNCQLPNNHIAVVQPKEKQMGKQGCMGKILVKRVPRGIFFKGGDAKDLAIQYILVKQSQAAALFRDGKLLAILPADKHDIISYSKDFNIIDIWFLDLSNISLKWGTKSKTAPPEMDEARAFGSAIVKINNPNNFILNVIGSNEEFWENDLQRYVRDRIRQSVNDGIAKRNSFDLYQDTKKFEMEVKINAKKLFENTGIELVDFSVSSIKFADEVEAAFKNRRIDMLSNDAELARLQKLKELGVDVGQYMRDQTLKDVAKSGSQAPAFMAAKALSKTPAVPAATPSAKICPKCGQPAGTGKFCQSCGSPLTAGKICPNCGQNAGTGKFCQNCGATIIANCPNCGQPPGSGNFCQNCGAPIGAIKNHCPNCGKQVSSGVKFCPNCGSQI